MTRMDMITMHNAGLIGCRGCSFYEPKDDISGTCLMCANEDGLEKYQDVTPNSLCEMYDGVLPNVDLEHSYQELLFTVDDQYKKKGETRHDAAKRFIQEGQRPFWSRLFSKKGK